uniref:Putative glycosyltransferase n=1 Tax=viral metagenome TaxID=1070528 RepID=A0A6M3JM10_9ZZZZ
MIVQNEEETIVRCLNHLLESELIKEICIVDGGSEDQTLPIISEVRASADPSVDWKVIVFPFDKNFGAQKTRALKLATKDWVLWIDADEIYDPDIFQALERLALLFDADGSEAFCFNRKTRIDGWLHNIIDPDYQIRFWKREGVTFVGRIHESPTGFRKLIKTNLTIQHNKTFAQQEADNENYWNNFGQIPPPDTELVDGKWKRKK